MSRKRITAVALALVVVLLAAWLWHRASTARAPTAPMHDREPAAQASASQAPPLAPPRTGTAAEAPAARAVSRAERDALRAKIAHALASQPPAIAPTAVPPASVGSARPERASDPRDAPGTLVDRTGDGELLVRHLNQDFMPLARECIAQAHERAPALAGMLAIDVEVMADARHGGVIDRVATAAINEVGDRELIECIEQTALTVVFPPPLATQRKSFQLTLRVRPVQDAGLAR